MSVRHPAIDNVVCARCTACFRDVYAKVSRACLTLSLFLSLFNVVALEKWSYARSDRKRRVFGKGVSHVRRSSLLSLYFTSRVKTVLRKSCTEYPRNTRFSHFSYLRLSSFFEKSIEVGFIFFNSV